MENPQRLSFDERVEPQAVNYLTRVEEQYLAF